MLGRREHTVELVRQMMLDDAARFVPLAIERRQGETRPFLKDTPEARYLG